jgi:hypothetical protein
VAVGDDSLDLSRERAAELGWFEFALTVAHTQHDDYEGLIRCIFRQPREVRVGVNPASGWKSDTDYNAVDGQRQRGPGAGCSLERVAEYPVQLDGAVFILEMHLHLDMFDRSGSSVGLRSPPDQTDRCGEQRQDKQRKSNAAGNDGVDEGAGTGRDGVAISTGTHTARPP